MHILRDLIQPLHNAFTGSDLGQRRATWFCYTLLAIMAPFTRSITSNLFRTLTCLFGFDIHQSRFYLFMGAKQMPWDKLWRIVWNQIRQPQTQGRLLLALDDFINPKTGVKIFGCGRFFDHAAKGNQKNYPWAQCVVTLGLLKQVKRRWACLPLSARFYIKKKDIEAHKINACVRGEPVTFDTKMVQASAMIEQLVSHYQSRALVICDSWFGNNGLWSLIQAQQHNQSVHLLSRLRSNNKLRAVLDSTDKPKKRGRPRKYGKVLGSADELATQYQGQAQELTMKLYGKHRQQRVYSQVLMLQTLRCQVRVVWVYHRSRYVALYTTDLSLSVQQIVEYYAARWKIEAAFKEIKQDIGSASSQTRDAYAVSNHLQMCLMAATITWQYAQRMNRTPTRRHAVNNRASFAFSDIRRSIAKEALTDDFTLGLPQQRQSANNSFFNTIMQLVA